MYKCYGVINWQREWYARRLIKTYGGPYFETIVDRKVRNVLLLGRWKSYVRYPVWIGAWLYRCIKYVGKCGYKKTRQWAVDTLHRLR